MAGRGRPKKPTEIKKAEGTYRVDRANELEPSPPKGIPLAPDYLNEDGMKAWDTFAPMLHDMGVLTIVDAPALASLCSAYVDLLAAQKAYSLLDGATYWVEGKTGNYKKEHPEFRILDAADKRFKSWLSAFGLTPESRSKVSCSFKKEAKNEFSEF